MNTTPVATTPFKLTIGCEIHAQLNGALCDHKAFSSAPICKATPNSHVSPFDHGLPGTLPVCNPQAVKCAVTAALALNCEIQKHSRFDRKHYSYPDLPNGMQITQYFKPIALGGSLKTETGNTVAINRIHIEHDAAKCFHDVFPHYTAVDDNRSGVGLIEIVTEPCIHDLQTLDSFLKSLRSILRTTNVCSCNMEDGEFRVDVSISLSETNELGVRSEIKNLNSFTNIQKAVLYEIQRQTSLLANKQQVLQETRLFDIKKSITVPMRSKENTADYRYLPEHNMPSLELTEGFIKDIASNMPRLPNQIAADLEAKGIMPFNAKLISQEPEYVRFFEQVTDNLHSHTELSTAAKLFTGDLFGLLAQSTKTLADFKALWLCEIVQLLTTDAISGKTSKELLKTALDMGCSPAHICKEQNLLQVSDVSQLASAAKEVIAAYPEETAKYHSGKTNLLGFFIGKLVERIPNANPKISREILVKSLGAG